MHRLVAFGATGFVVTAVVAFYYKWPDMQYCWRIARNDRRQWGWARTELLRAAGFILGTALIWPVSAYYAFHRQPKVYRDAVEQTEATVRTL